MFRVIVSDRVARLTFDTMDVRCAYSAVSGADMAFKLAGYKSVEHSDNVACALRKDDHFVYVTIEDK